MEKRILKDKKSFTLIEIIVVLIIVGTLAAIAIPYLFQWAQNSQAAEAIPIMKNFADQTDACIAKGQTAVSCLQPFSEGGGSTVFANTYWTQHYEYSYDTSEYADPGYIILATAIDSSGAVEPAGPYPGKNVCGSSSTYGTDRMTITLCRDPSANRSCETNGAYPGLF
jgi:prepilin-type N-terminal cleavage/methylation domain-containing protein